MARWSRIDVFKTMESTKLVPLAYHADPDILISIVKACYEGGARVFEFTSRGDFAHEVFNKVNKYSIEHLPEMILGVGSVTDAAAASLYMNLRANFIVTPVYRKDIAIVCNRKKVMWSPGCGSLTEICTAEEMGAELVKLFPGGIYGPGMIKAIKGPQPWTSVMPTGGVTPEKENLEKWFAAGATCVGMGSRLITKEIVANRDFEKLKNAVAQTMEILRAL